MTTNAEQPAQKATSEPVRELVEYQEPPLRMQRRSFLIVFVTVGIILAVAFMRPFATPLIFAAVFTVLLWPVLEWFQHKLKAGPVTAASLALITAHLTVLLPLTVVFVFTIRQMTELTATGILDRVELETHLIRVEALIHETFGTEVDLIGYIVDQWQKIAAESAKFVSAVLGRLALVVFQYVIATVFVFYLLVKGRELVDLIVEISPLGTQVNRRILNRFGETSRAVLWGTAVTVTAQGFVATIGLVLAGIDNAILWGVVMTFCAMVPVFGTALVWGPACFYTFMGGDTFSAIVILIFGLIASVVDNIIRPIIVGEATTVSTLWVLMSILGGIMTLGPVGVILGPALLAVFVECIDIYREEFLGYPQKQPRSGPRFRDIPAHSFPDAPRPDLTHVTPPATPASAPEPAKSAAQGS